MQYISHYASPLGSILLAADDCGLTGLWFEGQKYFARLLDHDHEERNSPVFETAKRWLDVYFSDREPEFDVPLHFTGTAFLWTDRPAACCTAGRSEHIRTGCGRCRGT